MGPDGFQIGKQSHTKEGCHPVPLFLCCKQAGDFVVRMLVQRAIDKETAFTHGWALLVDGQEFRWMNHSALCHSKTGAMPFR